MDKSKICDFQTFKTKTPFGGKIFRWVMKLDYALKEQLNLKEFNESTKQKIQTTKRKILIFENGNRLHMMEDLGGSKPIFDFSKLTE